MSAMPTVTLDGAQAVVSLPDAGERIARQVTATLTDHGTGERTRIVGLQGENSGAVVFDLPAALFDARERKLTLQSPDWEGVLCMTLHGMTESGEELSNEPTGDADRKLRGKVEYFDGEIVRGWAYDAEDADHRLKIDIFVNNRRLATVNADERRQNLVRAGLGGGRCGFFKVLPKAMLDGRRHVISCLFADNGRLLEDGVIELDVLALKKFVVKEIMWRIRRVESLLE